MRSEVAKRIRAKTPKSTDVKVRKYADNIPDDPKKEHPYHKPRKKNPVAFDILKKKYLLVDKDITVEAWTYLVIEAMEEYHEVKSKPKK